MSTVQTQTSTKLLSDRTYDVITKAATLILPLIGALYLGLGQIWGLPAVEQVVGTVAVLNVFAGGLSAVAKKMYDVSGDKYVGMVNVTTSETGKKLYELDMGDQLDRLDQMSEITFKVNKP